MSHKLQWQKISLVVSDLSGGGAARAFLLGQVLQTLKYDIDVVGFQFGQSLYLDPPQGIHVVAVPGATYPAFFRSAQRLLQAIEGDIIYAVKPKPTNFGLSLLKKLHTRRPVMLDIDDWELSWYGGFEWRYRPGLKQVARDLGKPNGALRFPDHPLYISWLERLVPYADAVTIDTQFLHDRFGGTYLPNGKDTQLFDPSRYDAAVSRQRYGLANYRVLMFPGAPRPHKGLEDVLMALDQLNQPDLRLVIVGGNPYDDYDDRLMQQWSRWVIKLPKFSIEAMPEVIAAAHVIVVPQRDSVIAKAQFPLKLTDGMAMAKPILSTTVGDIPQILDGTGYLVPPGSPDAIADQIQWIFAHYDQAIARGQQARQRCVQAYSAAAMADILEDILVNLRSRL